MEAPLPWPLAYPRCSDLACAVLDKPQSPSVPPQLAAHVPLRHSINKNKLLARMKEDPALKWADGKALRDELLAQLDTILGPEPAHGAPKPTKKTKKKAEKPGPSDEAGADDNGLVEAAYKVVDPFE